MKASIIAVIHEHKDSVVVLRIDPKNGRLTPTGQRAGYVVAGPDVAPAAFLKRDLPMRRAAAVAARAGWA